METLKQAIAERQELEKLNSEVLQQRYLKCCKVQDRTNKFDALQTEIYDILAERAYSAIYREACRVIKNRGRNQFDAARQYTDAVMDDCDFFPDNLSWEIGSYYTKNGLGAVVVYW